MQRNTTHAFSMARWMVGHVTFILLGMLVLPGCAPSHILHYREDVSRDFTTITFSGTTAPFRHKAQVGGEHMSFVNVLGFAGDVFLVELTAEMGDVGCSVSGEGIVVESDPAGGNKQMVTIAGGESLFTVALFAHPYGEYVLQISKL